MFGRFERKESFYEFHFYDENPMQTTSFLFLFETFRVGRKTKTPISGSVVFVLSIGVRFRTLWEIASYHLIVLLKMWEFPQITSLWQLISLWDGFSVYEVL
ncbi:hypothetical protein LEP1GSC175_1818 [Leptospira santarosai str. HAI821]|nr:hypothetical protein LEP1GSC175_1818 [Leptospira santarosai str. HAI821]